MLWNSRYSRCPWRCWWGQRPWDSRRSVWCLGGFCGRFRRWPSIAQWSREATLGSSCHSAAAEPCSLSQRRAVGGPSRYRPSWRVPWPFLGGGGTEWGVCGITWPTCLCRDIPGGGWLRTGTRDSCVRCGGHSNAAWCTCCPPYALARSKRPREGQAASRVRGGLSGGRKRVFCDDRRRRRNPRDWNANHHLKGWVWIWEWQLLKWSLRAITRLRRARTGHHCLLPTEKGPQMRHSGGRRMSGEEWK